MSRPHFLLVSLGGPSHINPTLQLAKRLIHIGVDVTFATTISALKRMADQTPTHYKGLTFVEFSDGYDEGFKSTIGLDLDHYMNSLRGIISAILSQLLSSSADLQGRPVAYIVSAMPWVTVVARELHVPSAVLWIQPATVLDIFYYYFKGGYGDEMKNLYNDPSCYIELPGLPLLLTCHDLPSFFSPSNTFTVALPFFQEQIESMCTDTNTKVLVNTFDDLEPEALKAVHNKFNLIAIGPLIPSAFLEGRDPSSDTSFGGDTVKNSKNYIEFLNSKPESSVIYIAFGSITVLSKEQKEEIARALLLESQRPFLWVISSSTTNEGQGKEDDNHELMKELEELGLIVPWCSQVEVLCHPSVGCFLTHCGWNSTIESLVSGVPVVGFPQWVEQGTNAKLVEDVWKTGLRVNGSERGIVGRDEIRRCLDVVMDGVERGQDMRKNAKKWRDLAREAMKEGGSSDKNLIHFVNQVKDEC